MARHVRVPGLLDVFTADEAGSIRSLDAHPRIDRVFDSEGPLVSRLLRGRIRSIFHLNGRLWPAFLPRGDAQRQKDTFALHIKLGGQSRRGSFDGEALDHLAGLLVAKEASRQAIGIALQQVIGRSFNTSFAATPETYAAADTLANWPRLGFFRALLATMTGTIGQARARILEVTGGDTYCAHAISLALPNMIATFERMREVRQATPDPGLVRSDTVVTRCLRGPKNLMRGVRPLVLPPDPRLALRRPNVKIDVAETRKPLRRGAIVRFDRGEAQSGDRRLVFAEDSWSACPARDWVPDLFAEIWRRSASKAGSPK